MPCPITCVCPLCIVIEANIQICDFKYVQEGDRFGVLDHPDFDRHDIHREEAHAICSIANSLVKQQKLTKRGKVATATTKDGKVTWTVECLLPKRWKVCLHVLHKDDDPN